MWNHHSTGGQPVLCCTRLEQENREVNMHLLTRLCRRLFPAKTIHPDPNQSSKHPLRFVALYPGYSNHQARLDRFKETYADRLDKAVFGVELI